MFRKIKLNPDQYKIVNELSNEMNYNKDAIANDLIELGIAVLIKARKSADTEEALNSLTHKIEVSHELTIMSQLLRKYFDAGLTNHKHK